MKTTLTLLLAALSFASVALGQPTAFTYQGRLSDNGVPATGAYDLEFRVFDASTAGTQQGGTVTVNDLGVTNGLFTVTLDPGAGVFTGPARWLEIAVRPGASTSGYTHLTPRHAILPTPYAIYAAEAGHAAVANVAATTSAALVGDVTGQQGSTAVALVGGETAANVARGAGAANAATSANTPNTIVKRDGTGNFSAGNIIASSFSGSGAGLTGLNAWSLGGNIATTPGTHFLGTTDNQPLEIKVNNTRALRLEPTANDANHAGIVNVVAGSPVNFIGPGVYGATIAGGGAASYFNNGPGSNSVFADLSTVGGGVANTIQGDAKYSTLGGGSYNTIQSGAYSSTLGGGYDNTIQSGAYNSTLAGGGGNTAIGPYAVVPGGDLNVAGANSFAAGHRAKALHSGSFVWADATDVDFATTGDNQFLIRATGGVWLSDSTPAISFGTQTRQMLNLYGTSYGIGVQAGSLYSRCNNAGPNDGFIWYRGGVHHDDYAQPGAGGTELMHLVPSGLFVNGAFIGASDRNLKENFKPVDPRAVLDKVAALPLSEWNYKTDTATRHVGPMAQDFFAAFGVGPDDKHIATVDADGVALAAIQGLNQKLEEQLNSKNAEIQSLKERLEALERRLQNAK